MNLLKKFLSDELHLDPELYLDKFIEFDKLILDWNKKINLISRKSTSTEEHILNSVFFLTKFDFSKINSIVDIGTGGGFPGIPLKILYPETEVLLVDSIKKKITAVDDIISGMGLKKIRAVCGRAESLSSESGYRKKFDAVISKAVAPLPELWEWGNGFLNDNGKMLCIKGGDITEELSELNKKKYKFNTEVINFDFAGIYGIEDKKLVVIPPRQSLTF